MRIKPVAFNYGELAQDMPDTEILPQRKNVVVRNKRYTMWGEHIDPENQMMMLTSISISREYTKESKQTILDEWENYLHQYATDEQPEEILARIEEKAQKEAKRAEEATAKAKAAEERAKAIKEKGKKEESKKEEKAS